MSNGDKRVDIRRTGKGWSVSPPDVEIDVLKNEQVVWFCEDADFEIEFATNGCPFQWGTPRKHMKKRVRNPSGRAKSTVNNKDRFKYNVRVDGVLIDPEVVIKR